jgi:hypothetical protein
MPVDMTKMPIASALGFTAAQATNQIKRNSAALKWWMNDVSHLTTAERKAYYTQIFNMMVEREPQNCGSEFDIGRELGLPAPLVRKIINEINTGTSDLMSKGEI